MVSVASRRRFSGASFRSERATVAGTGYHLLLNREDAKKLFAQPNPAATRDFVKQLAQSADARKRGRVLDLGPTWTALQRTLTDGTLDPTAGDPPLNHCVLGGKSLYQGDDAYVMLIRPDMAPYVAEALGEVDYETLHANYFKLDPVAYGQPLTEKDFERLWVLFQQVRDFFDYAAGDLSAVVFYGER